MDTPAIFILFGATGDLALKKIVPALAKLYERGDIPHKFSVIAFSRRPWTDIDYHNFVKKESLAGQDGTVDVDGFLSHVTYVQGQLQEDAVYINLAHAVREQEAMLGEAQTFFYFAVEPTFFPSMLHGLGKTKLLESKNAHVLVEKPFGSDAASAEELEKMFEQYIKGKQLLRVDHYLAKEGLQNMIAQRTENKELEAKLNAHFVEKIEARIFEKIGIEGRGEFYEKIGALKDVGQNHLLQMLASALMVLEDNDNKARAHALASLTLVGEPILGQYEGYTGETDVAKDSATETYFKIELESSMQQWQGVAITIEAGKAMRDKKAEVVVHFKDGTQHVFDIQHSPSGKDAYELLIEEALLGDKESFASFPEIIAAWKLLEPVFKKRDSNLIKKYTKGTNGPQ